MEMRHQTIFRFIDSTKVLFSGQEKLGRSEKDDKGKRARYRIAVYTQLEIRAVRKELKFATFRL
jgi:hypothetical protein